MSMQSATYWASYNNPYFSEIASLSGNADLCAENADACHDTDPRGLIFKARQGSVKNLLTLQKMMGYNRFQFDSVSKNDSCSVSNHLSFQNLVCIFFLIRCFLPFSLCSSIKTISFRMDLEPNERYQYPFGAIDAKISSVQSIMSTEVPVMFARLGPTHDTQPPFCWHKFDYIRNVRGLPLVRQGHPDCFDFDWAQFPPEH